MTFLAKRSIIKEDRSNIITLGAIAKEEKKKDPTVTNATIGMLYDEEGKLFAFKSVDKALNGLSLDEKYAYASTPGSKEFHEAVKSWVFREYYDLMKDNSKVMATPGGTGALSNTFANYLNEGDKALLPNYMWGNYKQCLYENNQSFDTYELFDNDGNFNILSLEEKMLESKKNQGRVLFVINDPCHNPTGYTMKDSEWDKVIDLMNEISADGTPVILLHDMAYIDYAKSGFEKTRFNISKYQKLNDNCLVVMAFSGSKTLALYGVRIGAQLAYSNNKEALEDFAKANKFSSRSKWSNPTNLGMNICIKALTDKEYKKSFEDELKEASKTLIERANIFLEEAKKVNLKTLPFECGFFITIPCLNPNLVYEKLVKKKVHIIPMGNVVRVTISAISKEECKKLPKLIKEAME
ncbi:MAG: aminotransferase class I/II-fold pyridoxal phosphate-dependent enzyme [Acholeplasmatales bacterium]|nr:aminotransferase class I/II-fold pyridoxal phosphate-dependent enzyme [Acholeplasmatales bacterium]